MSGDERTSNHDDALAVYLEELLGTRGAMEPEPEPGVLVQGGRILPDDDRYYVFSAGGLDVAIPAVRISAEQPLASTLEAAGDDPVQNLTLPAGASIPVFDLVRLMLPPSAPAAHKPLAQRAHRLILLDEGQWALAAEAPGRLESLAADQVCWRGDRATRTWLAGTVAARRLVLLDLDALAGMLP